MCPGLWHPKVETAGPASSQVRRCYGLHVSPTFTGSVLTAAPQNVTVFGDRVFKEVSMLSKGQSGGSSANKTGVLTKGGKEANLSLKPTVLFISDPR